MSSPDDAIERNGHDVRWPERGHDAELAPTRKLDRKRSESRSKHSILARRRAAALQMAEHVAP
jgi:hypothetical protein